MFSVVDIFLGAIVIAFFVHGFLKGFLGSILSLVAIGGSIFISLNYTNDFSNLLNSIPLVGSYPILALIVVFIISYIFLSIAARALSTLFSKTTILGNPLLSLVGGIIFAMISILVISVIYTLLRENGVDLNNYVSSFNNSYSKVIIDYCNSGLDLSTKVKELFQAFVNEANNYAK
ncbi:hypothetical protein CJP74_03575 [Psittacicella melopsittaci]|uniref:Colicin V production protein n=1 Tax=Psittacicella melopsittaci TaxID=2028576 RepID=A0A3A1Y6E8_9GAMM|nr:CvpA family protein [Psittacicella melopsittaci]RIY32788.1 hypothetical protein CJP74_03575 [Psittacicella melopsittaci]